MDADYANDIQEEARQRRKEHFLDPESCQYNHIDDMN